MTSKRKAVYTESHRGPEREPEIIFTPASGEGNVEFRPSPALEEKATHRQAGHVHKSTESARRTGESRSSKDTRTTTPLKTRAVRTVMTPRVVAVTTVTFLPEAAQIMLQEDVGALPVVQADGTLLGIITDRDITVRAVAEGRDVSQTQVSEIYTAEDLVTITADTPIADAENIMAHHQVRRLPIVEAKNRLVGMVTLADLAQLGNGDVEKVMKDLTHPGGSHTQSS